MPVAVARTDRDEGEPGPHPGVQHGILVRGAVVRDLEDIHRTQFRMVPQEALLRDRFEIAEQQQGQPRAAHQQGDARVVGPLRRRPRGRGPEHLPLQRSGPPPLPRHRPHDGYAGARRGPVDELRLPGRIFQRGGLNHTHRPPPQHPGQARHVVGVVAFSTVCTSHERWPHRKIGDSYIWASLAEDHVLRVALRGEVHP